MDKEYNDLLDLHKYPDLERDEELQGEILGRLEDAKKAKGDLQKKKDALQKLMKDLEDSYDLPE